MSLLPDGFFGQRDAKSTSTINSLNFFVNQLLGKVNTATLVRVDACSHSGGLSEVGTVDVTPMVHMVDGIGRPTPHDTIYGLPYFRIQGGNNAVIIDPAPGDIGIAVFASRDISSVKKSKKPSSPGSFRRFDFADGMYLGGVLNGVPTQYVRFHSSGISIYSSGTVDITASTVNVNGDITATGDITAGTVSLKTHVHGGVTPGGSVTSGPV